MFTLLIALSAAHAAPGQSGVLYPSAVPPDHSARVGIAGGAIWWFDSYAHGLTAVDLSVQPVDGVQVASMISLQADGRASADPAYGVLTVTAPWESNIKLAASVAFGVFDRRVGGATGLLLGNHSGKVHWDLGAYPLVVDYKHDYGWAEIRDDDRTPRWDLRPEWRTITAGLSFGMSDRWRVRIGVPDGLTFSYASRRFYLDAGGGTLYHLGGLAYLKSGFRF